MYLDENTHTNGMKVALKSLKRADTVTLEFDVKYATKDSSGAFEYVAGTDIRNKAFVGYVNTDTSGSSDKWSKQVESNTQVTKLPQIHGVTAPVNAMMLITITKSRIKRSYPLHLSAVKRSSM